MDLNKTKNLEKTGVDMFPLHPVSTQFQVAMQYDLDACKLPQTR
jgi:hypothetical protein